MKAKLSSESCLDDFLQVARLTQHLGQARLALEPQQLMEDAFAQVGVHQHHARAAEGQGPGEVGGDGGFAFVGHGAGDEQDLRALAFDRHEKDGRPKVAVGLGKHMPFIVDGQQGQRGAALEAGDLRHLADDVLAELLGDLDEGGEAVVAQGDEEDDAEAKAQAAETRQAQEAGLLGVGAFGSGGGLENGEGFLVDVPADADVLDEHA